MRAITVLTLGLLAFGCDSAPTKKTSEPEPVAKAKPAEPAPATVTKPKPDPTPKKETPAKVEPKREAPKASEFDKAWDELGVLAARLRKSGEATFAEKKGMFTAAEVDLIESMIAHKPTPQTHVGATEVVLLSKSGLSKLDTGLTCQWAMTQPDFKPTAIAIWNRTPKTRGIEALGSLAAKWMVCPPDKERAAFIRAIKLVEAGKEITANQKELVISIAGDEYYSNRP